MVAQCANILNKSHSSRSRRASSNNIGSWLTIRMMLGKNFREYKVSKERNFHRNGHLLKDMLNLHGYISNGIICVDTGSVTTVYRQCLIFWVYEKKSYDKNRLQEPQSLRRSSRINQVIILRTRQGVISANVHAITYKQVVTNHQIADSSNECAICLEKFKPRTYVDHINSIKSDNRVANLRWVNRSENLTFAIGKRIEVSDENEKIIDKFDTIAGFVNAYRSIIANIAEKFLDMESFTLINLETSHLNRVNQLNDKKKIGGVLFS